MLPQNKIDWDFLNKEEGGSCLNAYVPKIKDGKILSGVTVGCGIDLGQRNENDLAVLDLPFSLHEKLKPYLLLKGNSAAQFLEKNPLSITEDQARILNHAVRDHDIGLMIRIYERFSKLKFLNIPAQAQTVLASLAWNFGPSLDRSIPSTFTSAVIGDWKNFGFKLKNFPGEAALKARRNREAALIESIYT